MVPVLNTIGTDVSCVGVGRMTRVDALVADRTCRTTTWISV
jgi:hypothetical protein